MIHQINKFEVIPTLWNVRGQSFLPTILPNFKVSILIQCPPHSTRVTEWYSIDFRIYLFLEIQAIDLFLRVFKWNVLCFAVLWQDYRDLLRGLWEGFPFIQWVQKGVCWWLLSNWRRQGLDVWHLLWAGPTLCLWWTWRLRTLARWFCCSLW